jgi:polysaccharide biosynthesis transport protein
MEEDAKSVGDYVDIVKRRKWSIVLPIVILFAIAFVVALLLPRTYRSTSTILIEDQDIPRDFVVSTIQGFAEERLQAINQRIMSATRLIEIMNRFNLYQDLRRKMTVEEIVELMRKDIKFQTISSNVIDRRTGQPSMATIAFTLSYDGKEPQVVQQVANQLASLYLEENLKTRAEQTAGASRFLEEEARSMQAKLTDLDGKIAAFKARNINALPELVQVNFQSLDRVEQDLSRLKDDLKSLKSKEEYLQIQLATMPTDAASQDKNLLRELKAKLLTLQSRYSDKYPDVTKTKEDIAQLEKRIASSPPDSPSRPKKLTSVADQPDNAAYVALASQLASVESDIDSVKRQIIDAQNKREDYEKRTQAGPRVEESYKALMTERNNAQLKYDDLMKRVMEAKVAQGLEKQQMGERFTLIDPARLPEKPISPNVPAILLIGAFLGIAGGVGNVSLREFGDQSVRTPGALAAATGLPVLGAVPLIVTEEDRQAARARRRKVLAVIAVLCIVAIVSFHFFVMDLDVFWAKLSRRLML